MVDDSKHESEARTTKGLNARMWAWEEFLKKLDGRFGKQTIDKWLRSLQVVHFDSGNLYLEATDSFQVSWFEEHARPLLKRELLNNNFRPIKVHISLQGPASIRAPAKKEKPKAAYSFLPDKIDPAASLFTYIPAASNSVSFRFLSELAGLDSPQLQLGTYNPIFIWGEPGCGKTHLLMALADAFKRRGLHALYTRTETFTEHVVSAIRNSEMQAFRTTYRTPDILLFDDVHLLARKDATQEEFFHTFNTLHSTGRQIILASQQPAAHLSDIEPRLISRFEWGIALHVEKLQSQELAQVLERRCEHLHFPLSSEVRSFLIEQFPQAHSLHRALEALILRVHMQESALYHRQPGLIDTAVAAQLLRDLLEKEQNRALTPQKIIQAVAAQYGVKMEDILGKSQNQECVAPRQVAMYLCRKELRLAFAAIGRIFSRDHSTVMTSVKYIQQQVDKQDRSMVSVLFDISNTISKK